MVAIPLARLALIIIIIITDMSVSSVQRGRLKKKERSHEEFGKNKQQFVESGSLRGRGRRIQRKRIPNAYYLKECEKNEMYKRKSFAESGINSNFTWAIEKLTNGFSDEEDRSLFRSKIVEQITGKEVELSCSRTESHFVEMLLATCGDGSIVMKFADAFSSSLRQVCTNQYGSHVMESLLLCASNILKKNAVSGNSNQKNEDEPNSISSITSWILKFGKFCLNNVEHFLGHIYASHILRALTEVWSGVKMELAVRKSKKSINKKRKFQSSEEYLSLLDVAETVDSNEFEVPEEFISQLREFYQKIAEIGNLIDCSIDPKVSPVLQTLLVGLQKRAPKLCQKFIKLLMKGAVVRKDDKGLPLILTDKSSSCLVEKILLAADEKRQKWMWKHYFKDNMESLAIHPISNIVVQRLFSAIKGKEQFGEILNEVGQYFGEMFSSGYICVIVSVAEACERLGICQAHFMQMIMKTLDCLEPEERQLYLVPLTLQQIPYNVYEKSEKISENSMLLKNVELSSYGSRLVQHMLRFHKPVKVVNSILSMKNDLDVIACDAKGSYVLESYLTGPHVGEKNRDKLLNVLKPHLLSLACDKFGSRVLDAIWSTASLKHRTLVCQELSEKENELTDNTYGRYISKKYGLFYFKHRNSDWKQTQNTATKKRKLFNDFLS